MCWIIHFFYLQIAYALFFLITVLDQFFGDFMYLLFVSFIVLLIYISFFFFWRVIYISYNLETWFKNIYFVFFSCFSVDFEEKLTYSEFTLVLLRDFIFMCEYLSKKIFVCWWEILIMIQHIMFFFFFRKKGVSRWKIYERRAYFSFFNYKHYKLFFTKFLNWFLGIKKPPK